VVKAITNGANYKYKKQLNLNEHIMTTCCFDISTLMIKYTP